MTFRGTVQSVETTHPRGFLASDQTLGSTSLPVNGGQVFVDDFNDTDTGSVVINGQTYAYTGVTVEDDESVTPSTLVITPGLVQDELNGEPVDLVTATVTTSALVSDGTGGDLIGTLVPHNLANYTALSDGIRAPGTEEVVDVAEGVDGYEIVNVIGRRSLTDAALLDPTTTVPDGSLDDTQMKADLDAAEVAIVVAGTNASTALANAAAAIVTADAADAAAATALSTANGKNKIIFSASAASGTSYVDGDVWFQKSASLIIAQWEFVSGAWASRTLDNAVIANLNAGKITAGFLDASAVTIRTGASGARVELKSTGIIGYDSGGLAKTTIDATTGRITATDVTVTGTINATSGTFTGIIDLSGSGVIRTAAAGQRVQMGTSGIVSYDAANAVTTTLAAASGGLSLAGNLDMSGTGAIRTGSGNDRVEVTTAGVTLYTDDPARIMSFTTPAFPTGIAVDTSGNVYVTDQSNAMVRKFTSAGVPVWSTTTVGTPYGVAVDSAGNVYVADFAGGLIRKYSSAGVAGITWAVIGTPYAVAVDSSNNVYVTDTTNNRVRKYTSTGTAGINFSTTGVPYGIAVDSAGNIFTTDNTNNLVRKFSSAGAAGITFATASGPRGVAVDSTTGTIYVTDNTRVIRTYSSTGVAGVTWYTSDLANNWIALDSAGNSYITDSGSLVIKFNNATGVTIASATLGTATGRLTGLQGDIGRLAVDSLVPRGPSLAISGLVDPALAQDAATKFYTDAQDVAAKNRANHTGSPTAAWSNGSQKITSVADPTLAQDAATKAYTDAQGVLDRNRANHTGSPTAAWSNGSQQITSVADPTLAQDAATKAYADSLVLADSGWVTVPAISPFTIGNLAVRKIGSMVIMRGYVSRASGWTSTALVNAATVPVGYRPTVDHYFGLGQPSANAGFGVRGVVSTAGILQIGMEAASTGGMGAATTWFID